MTLDLGRAGHDEDAAPLDPTIRERLESMDVVRGILIGAALSAPVWAVIGSALAAAHALGLR